MTEEYLAKLERLVRMATPGPWRNGQVEDHPDIPSIHGGNKSTVVVDDRTIHDGYAVKPADVEFIVAARAAVPELVAEVRRLRAELAKHTPPKNDPRKRDGETMKWA